MRARLTIGISAPAALRLAFLVLLNAMNVAAAPARELASAPEVRILGFSADGRHFAYEQYENDDVSDTAISAIDVIDRDTGASAKGFPFGFLGVSKGDEFPMRVGNHKIALKEDLSGAERLAALRQTVARQTRQRLSALGIGAPGRRLAGFSITDRSGGDAPEFVLSPTLPGGVPDTQQVYRASASFTPADFETCTGDMKVRDHVIVLKIDALDRDKEAVLQTAEAKVPWPAGRDACATSVRITDIVAAPQRKDQPSYVAVVMLAISWGGHAETSRYFASFVKLP